jgi:glycyl-tRNA synthetase beta chain
VTLVAVETRSSKPETRKKRAAGKSGAPQTLPLLLEVGCEEIPARFLRDAEKGLGERVRAALGEARLLPNGKGTPWRAPTETTSEVPQEVALRTYSTPRRLVVHAPALLAYQPERVEEIVGPPVKVAVDPEGKYTRAAESFAEKNSARLEDLTRTTTPKGEYLALRKTTQGRPARQILPEILPPAILGLSFPKSMYWTEKSAPRFVRPIRWVLATLGEGRLAEAVEFEILGVKASNFTFGHRVKSSKPVWVIGFKNYLKKLTKSYVEIDPANRMERVIQGTQALVEKTGLKIVRDEWLVNWVVNSTEWPRSILGSFDERFLHLPREILITVMRDHQKYFAVEDGQGNLRPHFIAVLNTDSDVKGLIRQGHERVLTARFRDAEFFWKADQRTALRDRLALLEKVTYQAELGSYGDKLRRMKALAMHLCDCLEAPGLLKAGQREQVLRAVDLCKCDLTTQMVQEFPELQGVVGGLYAEAQGELEEVAIAVYDHYLPLGAEGDSPRTTVGALVSLADKLDSVVAGCAAGHEPTGSSDPFALRRQANGALKVILELSLAVDMKETVNQALDALETQYFSTVLADDSFPASSQAQQAFATKWANNRPKVHARVLDFFAERLRYYLESVRGFRYDSVRAVMAAGAEQPADAQARAEAMEALRGSDDFEALSVAAKRIRNILSKSASAADWQVGEVEAALLNEPQEKDLYEAYGKVAAEAKGSASTRDYRRGLEVISTLRPTVDRFFDKVLVMAEDRVLRQNRLRLLKKLDELFSGIADFAEIEGQ